MPQACQNLAPEPSRETRSPVVVDGWLTPEKASLMSSYLPGLRSQVGPAPTQVPPRAPATIYFIPGCYLGDVPPKDAGLPAGCDASRAVTFKN